MYRGIANCFLDDEDDKTYAFSIIINLRHFTSNPFGQGSCTVTQINDNSRNDNDTERKLAPNLLPRFKKEESFTGKLGESIELYFNNYEAASKILH